MNFTLLRKNVQPIVFLNGKFFGSEKEFIPYLKSRYNLTPPNDLLNR
jgi:hypothetical protein